MLQTHRVHIQDQNPKCLVVGITVSNKWIKWMEWSKLSGTAEMEHVRTQLVLTLVMVIRNIHTVVKEICVIHRLQYTQFLFYIPHLSTLCSNYSVDYSIIITDSI